MDFLKISMGKSILISILVFAFFIKGFTQSNWSSNIDSGNSDTIGQLVSHTFSSTRLINFQTVETRKKGGLEFRISHRFGELKGGGDFLWGLDGPANIHIGMDYNLFDNLVIGIGRTSNGKLADGFLKYKLLKQKVGKGSPISLVWLSSINITSLKDANAASNGFNKYAYFSSRLSFMHQVIVARKFSSRLSAQLMPTLVHYNLVEKLSDKNDIFAIPIAAKFNLTKHLAITGEYTIPTFAHVRDKSLYHNAASFGLDIETGGHVFQLFSTNAIGINEVQTIPYTSSSWTKGQARFGFNLSRVF
jgi:hypothetical protein